MPQNEMEFEGTYVFDPMQIDENLNIVVESMNPLFFKWFLRTLTSLPIYQFLFSRISK